MSKEELVAAPAHAAAEADRACAQAGDSRRRAVGRTTDQGLTQSEIARVIDLIARLKSAAERPTG